MKTFWLYLILFLTTKGIISQVVFCPPGAQWNYMWTYSFWPYPPPSYNEVISYVGDTLIAGETVKKLNHTFFSFECMNGNCHPTFLKQNGDTIFMLNNCTMGNWQILYNFAANINQGWTNTLLRSPLATIPTQYSISVVSINTITINGLSVKELDLSYSYGGSQYFGKINERFGSNIFLFHFQKRDATDCHFVAGLLCYKDSTFGSFQSGQLPCDYSNPISVVEYNNRSSNLILSPNPARDYLEIQSQLENDISIVSLSDASGKLIELPLSKNMRLNISELSPGIYILEIRNESGTVHHYGKFIKSE